MAHTEVGMMKDRLLDIAVTQMERIVLLDMAAALARGSTRYTWGHDRLALAIGKRPGTPAAKQALSGRILPGLISKGLIRKASDAYPGHNAEYEVLALHAPEMGNGSEQMGNGSDPEWVTVSDGMGNAQTVTPSSLTPTTHTDISHQERPGKPSAPGGERIASERQRRFLRDLDVLGGDTAPSHAVNSWIENLTVADADAEIREALSVLPRGTGYRGPVAGDPAYALLSDDGKRWADARGVPSAMEAA